MKLRAINLIQLLKAFLKKQKSFGKIHNLNETDQIMSAIFLIAVLILILPSFLSTNYKLKEFLRNLSIWAIITLVIIVIIYFISL